MTQGEIERRAVVLHYASTSARLLLEKDTQKISLIKEEMREIEFSLGMTPSEILYEAAKLTQR